MMYIPILILFPLGKEGVLHATSSQARTLTLGGMGLEGKRPYHWGLDLFLAAEISKSMFTKGA